MTNPPENSVHPKSRAEWRVWLQENHTRMQGVWIISFKKVTGKPRLEYDEIVEEALCFGWVDSKTNALDDEQSMLWLAPRRPRSGWSQRNKERVEKLIQARKMTPAGQAVIDAAKNDGSWNALDAVEALETPPDLLKVLADHPPALENFDAFPRSVKRAILEWITAAKKAETRASRIEETVRLAAENIRANQWRP